jgi:hypothetical protein
MERSTYKWFTIAIVVALSFGVAACAGTVNEDSQADAGAMSAEGGEEGGEHAEGAEARGEEGGERAEGGGEEGGEHAEGSEARNEERGEEGGEHAEGGEARNQERDEGGEGEHGEEGSHGEGEEGEESGIYLARNATWDRTRRGARLVLTFDSSKNAFVGTVENTTEQMLCAVRVEVHLDTPRELGPTPRTDVPVGGKIDVELSVEGNSFETWTAHPEISSCGSGS